MDNRTMFYGASPAIFERAKRLRLCMTPSELKLWEEVRNNKLGVRFKAQHPIKNFIADFYCHKAKLVVELDGGIHLIESVKEHDGGRTYELEQLGIKVIRFTNYEVENNLVGVLYKIGLELEGRYP